MEFGVRCVVRRVVDRDEKINREERVRIIGECWEEVDRVNLRVIYGGEIRWGLIGEWLWEVDEDMGVGVWKSKGGKGCCECRSRV